MKLRFSMASSILLLGLVQGSVVFSVHAKQSFPLGAQYYSSTQFNPSEQVERQLFYRSDKGNEYHFNQSPKGFELHSVSKGSHNIFSYIVPANNSFVEEKQLLVNGSIKSIKKLEGQLADTLEDIKSVKQKITAASSPEEKSEIAAEQLSPLSKKKSSLTSQIRRFETEVNVIIQQPVISLFDLFKTQPKGDVIVAHEQYLYLLRSVERRVTSKAEIIQGNRQARSYSYVNRSYLKFGKNSSNRGDNEPFFTLEKFQNTVTGFNYDQVQYTLTRIEDTKIRDLLAKIKSTPVEPNSFEFKGDVLTTRYQWKKSNSETKSLLVEYKHTGKKKNLIQVRTEGETQVYDPKTPSSNIVKHIGILAPTKSGALLEIKKVQKTNDKIDGSWAFDYKKRLLKLGEQILVVEKENYYGFEGLWYLAYWMVDNAIQSKTVYLINGLEPIALTAISKGDQVEFTIGGKVMYRFSFDNNKFVKKLEFVPGSQVLELISKDTTTTVRNRNKLISYMQKNGIIKL